MIVQSNVLMNRVLFGALVLSILLFGCSAASRIDPIITRPPLVEPLPLVVGVYFSPEFRTYQSKCDRNKFGWYCPYTEYAVGAPSVALFDLLLTGLFKSVIAVDVMPPAQPIPNIHGIIVPTITQDHALGWEITYHVTLYSAAGIEFGGWDVGGGSASSEATLTRDLFRLAMRDAAAKFVRGFHQQAVVKNWMKQAGIASPERIPQTSPKVDAGATP